MQRKKERETKKEGRRNRRTERGRVRVVKCKRTQVPFSSNHISSVHSLNSVPIARTRSTTPFQVKSLIVQSRAHPITQALSIHGKINTQERQKLVITPSNYHIPLLTLAIDII